MAEFLDVDPRTLRLPTSRRQGANPAKFARQLSRFGKSTTGMPPPEVVRGAGGELMVMDGVTRATRVARFLPGQTVRVEVTHDYPNWDFSALLTIGDVLP